MCGIFNIQSICVFNTANITALAWCVPVDAPQLQAAGLAHFFSAQCSQDRREVTRAVFPSHCQHGNTKIRDPSPPKTTSSYFPSWSHTSQCPSSHSFPVLYHWPPCSGVLYKRKHQFWGSDMFKTCDTLFLSLSPLLSPFASVSNRPSPPSLASSLLFVPMVPF